MDIQMINELVKILEQEAGLYGEILDIAKNKTNIIIEGKISELESIVKLEQSIFLQMGRLEDQREGLVEKLSGQIGRKPAEVNVSVLMENMDEVSRQKLKAYQAKMSGIVSDLRNSNELNSRLIRNSLDYINFSINLLTEANSVSNSYGNDGQVSDSKKRNLFDVKL